MSVICFDLDGNLSDPKLGITRSIQHALRELGRPVPTADDLSWCIGPPLLGSFKKLLGSRKEAENALLLYRERFTETGIYENELYSGIAAALSGLKSSGRRMFVATSKPKAEFDGTRSDKSDLLGWVVAQERLSPAKTVMVGDRSHDIAGGRKNGMATLGVLYGYGTMAELLEAGADDLCQSPTDLTLHLCG